ncbi:DUF4383 domain-containing protein [Actinomycetospora termitidis]|uniref:DUF4383 domain-containing protein n=1 Tax=Actinomycetospora termitidis TaxID=3053470 RepID=A0ABT7MCS4_9PSEU|nr:DUF4383 domain-containing protein [Actinomycetospora sp. Odt1-22]MDL5158483.1 DUF4383 domain-containing protein [Actinomycetospora sp. Odt1-22]
MTDIDRSDLTPDHKVVVVHRAGAVVVALVIAAFGVLGFVGGLAFFDTQGTQVLGLSSNGLLSTISIVTAVVLLAAAARGGRLSSTVMMVVGGLFLVSAFANLAIMATPYNLLAFRLPNVFFSIGAGLVLLILGSYGRVSAKLPDDNPYREPQEDERSDDPEASLPSRPHNRREQAADREMAEASRAVGHGTATDEQRRRLAEIDHLRTHEERRERWMASAHGSAQA